MIDILSARIRLLTVWAVGAGIVGLLLLLRANAGAYDADPSAPWSWFGAAFLPTLTLMAGSAFSTEDGARVVRRELFHITLGACAFYMLAALIPLFAGRQDPVAALKGALWIPALQGIVTLFVGKLFTSAAAPKAAGAKEN